MDASSILTILYWTVGIVTAVLVGKLLLVLTKNTHYARMVEAVPGPRTVPIFGNAMALWVPPEDVFHAFINIANEVAKETVSRYWIGPFEARFMVHTAKGAETIMNNTRHITKADEYSFFHSWLGLGLLTSTGNKWLVHRKMLTPSFHFKILEDFITVFNEQSQILVGLLKKREGSGAFNIFPYITHCALDIICESAMGTHHNAQNCDSEYVKAVYGIGALLVRRLVRPWLGNRFLFNLFPEKRQETHYLNILHKHSRKVIKERREFHQNNANTVETDKEEIYGQKRRLAFLDMLLDAQLDGKKLSDTEIREEVDTFMFEGHDTTSAAITWSLFLLGHHPDIQTRLRDEVDNILGDSKRPISAADISRMKYLEAIIKEGLRLYPSVPMYARKLKEDVFVGNYHYKQGADPQKHYCHYIPQNCKLCQTYSDGHTIPAESNVYIGAYFIHRNPDVFPDPEEFKPERFLDQDATKRHPFAYVPFSAGPRNCIGQKFAMMEQKVVLADIVRNFSIISHDQREDLKMVTEPILRPAFGLNVSLERRPKTIS